MKTAVFIQYSGIGDLVWHIGYMKALAETSGDGRVTVIAQSTTLARSLLSGQAWVNEVIDHKYSHREEATKGGAHVGVRGMINFARELRKKKFNRVVIFGPHASRALICFLAGIPQRIGFGYKRVQKLCLSSGPYIPRYNGPAVGAFHEATMLMQSHGFCDRAIVPRLQVPVEVSERSRIWLEGLPRQIITLAIGTSQADKQWGERNFAHLARLFAQNGVGIILLGGPAERALAHAIVTALPQSQRPLVKALTECPILEGAAILASSRMCIGNDTGIANLAAAVRCPTYVVLGPRKPLTHDPVYLHNLVAPSLQHLTPELVYKTVVSGFEFPQEGVNSVDDCMESNLAR